ncbi:hypothetical protein E8E13_011094 [Curvularia kusanoi]|uniref:Uncharacterized protein n=1 Tax=Curvularia kusanoi TaxID=90978 RepID=A0A9P4WDF5_CURKU|nr:hypothetical protein E8E13_011094 [Curvularia kusanoi]
MTGEHITRHGYCYTLGEFRRPNNEKTEAISRARHTGPSYQLPSQAFRHRIAAPADRILDRLEYLIQLVESGSALRSSNLDVAGVGCQVIRDVVSEEGRPGNGDGVNGNRFAIASVPSPRSESTPECLEQEANQHTYFGSGLDVLDWPVFEGRYDRRWIEALIFDPTLPCGDGYGPCLGVGVREDDVPHLIETFLVNVHVKNPIFDPAYLRKIGKSVAEHGFDWKAPSCLVVIVVCLRTSFDLISIPSITPRTLVSRDLN